MFRQILPAVGCIVLIGSLAQASTFQGPSYVEPGDAGSGRDSAKDVTNPNGTGPIDSISGSLDGTGGLRGFNGDFQDVYRIYIEKPWEFKIQLQGDLPSGVPDSMMFLFNNIGNPIMASNNANPDNLNPILDNVDNPFGIEPGVFYLAITSAPSEALVQIDGMTISLFNLIEHPFGTVGPADNAQSLEWTDLWTEPDPVNFGEYLMHVDGVVSMPIPGPSGVALLALAGVIGGRRRRR